jgi:hypothetical protein
MDLKFISDIQIDKFNNNNKLLRLKITDIYNRSRQTVAMVVMVVGGLEQNEEE